MSTKNQKQLVVLLDLRPVLRAIIYLTGVKSIVSKIVIRFHNLVCTLNYNIILVRIIIISFFIIKNILQNKRGGYDEFDSNYCGRKKKEI